MLSAKEAREIVENSDVEVLKSLKMFDEQIRYAAAQGKREYFYRMGAVEMFLGMTALKPLTVSVIAKLEALGYGVKYTFYGDSYVPRGLADDDGNGPEYTNYGIIVGW